MGFSENLKKLREQKELSQDQLGLLAGVNGRQISKYEHNKVEPNLKTLKKLAEVLEISIDDLIKNDFESNSYDYKDRELMTLFEKIDKLKAKEKQIVKYLLRKLLK